jgi:hypothetical protein
MKRSRFSLLVVALLLLAMTLSACGKGKTASITEYLNDDYDLSDDQYTKATALGLDDYYIMDLYSNDKFVVFAESKDGIVEEGPVTQSYKILSMYSGTIIQELVDSETVDIEFIPKQNSIVVKKSVLDDTGINKTPDVTDMEGVALAQAAEAFRKGMALEATKLLLEDYITETYTLYDGTGAAVATTNYEAEVSYFYDMIVYDDVAYKVDAKTGAWTKEIEIPEYIAIGNVFMGTDDYYYVGRGDALTVYNKKLEEVACFAMPNYGDESVVRLSEMFNGVYPVPLLNNGDFVYQYGLVMDEDAKDYDFIYVKEGETVKIDLVTLLFSIEDKKVKELDLDYVITELTSNYASYDNSRSAAENYIIKGSFENIATIAPIVDGRVLLAEDKQEFVMLDNDLKVVKSLKLLENQINELPEKIADDLYSVDLMSGAIALVNGAGEVQKIVSGDLRRIGAYFVGEDAIYDLSLNVVQSLKDPDVSYEFLRDSILVTTKTNSKEYKIVLLCDGKTTDVYTHEKDAKTRFAFGTGYYYIVNEANGSTEYKYYTMDGKEMVTTDRELRLVKYSYDTCVAIFAGYPNGEMIPEDVVVDYYVFSK